jgi:ParB family transcriptional regulator, chromosome partitioning protein
MELMQVEQWPIEKLRANPLNPRGAIGPEDDGIQELADSIIAQGILQPLLIAPDGLIIAGHRRHAAALIAQLSQLPVTVHDLSKSDQLAVMLVENLQRQGLSTFQTAVAYQTLHDMGLSIKEIAAKVGYHATTVRNHLAITRLPESLHVHFTDAGDLGVGHAVLLHDLLTTDEQKIQFAQQAIENRWLIEDLATAIQKYRKADSGDLQEFNPPVRPRALAETVKMLLDDCNPKRKCLNYSWDQLENARLALVDVPDWSPYAELVAGIQEELLDLETKLVEEIEEAIKRKAS